MYHDVFRTRPTLGLSKHTRIYHVSARLFAKHLDVIQSSGRRVLAVGDCLTSGKASGDAVVLTFDDGWQGTCDVAVPLLLERGWRATIFVTKDFVGRSGFVSASTLRAVADAGMEIGVHGVTHRMLSGCSRAEVVEEFRACREYLESLLGRAVQQASAPGGDTTPTVVDGAIEAGLQSLSTSRPGINSPNTPLFDLRRVAIKEDSSADDVSRFCRFRLGRERARWMLMQMPRTLLGMERYAMVRRWLLDGANGKARSS